MNKCPICGARSVDITTHEDSERRLLCTGPGQHEWRPDRTVAERIEEEPQPGVYKTLRDLLRKAF